MELRNRIASMEGMPAKACAVFFLLLLYLAASVDLQSWHKLSHADEWAALHSPEHEKDPCHRTIYHHDTENGCDHESHITTADGCTCCSIVLHTEHVVPAPQVGISCSSPQVQAITCIPQAIIRTVVYRPSRAPPAV